MKKLFMFAVIGAFATTLIATSCKKKDATGNYSCVCTETISGTATTVPAIPLNNMTKSQAQSDCATEQTSATTAAAGAFTVTCALN